MPISRTPVVRIAASARPIRRGLIAAGAGALLLLGAACTGGSDAPASEAESDGTVANTQAAAPDQPVLVAAAVSAAPAADSAPQLPDWVTRRLETDPPKLALTYPAEGSTFTESYVMFSGQAEPGSVIAAGPFETVADQHGQWSIGLVLSAGQNVATFSTTSEEGVVTKESVTVHYQGRQNAYAVSTDSKLDGAKDHDGSICPLKQ